MWQIGKLSYLRTYLITDTCFGLIGPHQCDAEYPIDRKFLSAMGDSNPGLTGESPVFYHYINKVDIYIYISKLNRTLNL